MLYAHCGGSFVFTTKKWRANYIIHTETISCEPLLGILIAGFLGRVLVMMVFDRVDANNMRACCVIYSRVNR